MIVLATRRSPVATSPLNPVKSTPVHSSASADSKRLTQILTPLYATLTKNQRVGSTDFSLCPFNRCRSCDVGGRPLRLGVRTQNDRMLSHSMTTHVQALVVGAGISGLACGYYLRKSGIDAQIVEASPRPGGMIRSERRDGYLLELGPQSFSSTAQLAELCRDLGIQHE